MQQGVQTDATFNIQQCWELLANNVMSVWTGLNIFLNLIIYLYPFIIVIFPQKLILSR